MPNPRVRYTGYNREFWSPKWVRMISSPFTPFTHEGNSNSLSWWCLENKTFHWTFGISQISKKRVSFVVKDNWLIWLLSSYTNPSLSLSLAIKCIKGLCLWRNSSSEINDELFKGDQDGNSERIANEIIAGKVYWISLMFCLENCFLNPYLVFNYSHSLWSLELKWQEV